jgi:hypothetical protein
MVARQTLSGSDYGLLSDDGSFTPRPDYWASVIFRRLVGNRALAASITPGGEASVPILAHAACSRTAPGAVVAFVIDLDRTRGAEVTLPAASDARVWLLSAPALDAQTILVNGVELRANADGSLPPLDGAPLAGPTLSLPPASIAFVVFPSAKASAC